MPNSSRWSPITRKSLITRGPVRDRARQVGEHPAPVMPAQRRWQRRRQPGRQARPVRQLPQQRQPGVRHDARTAPGDFKATGLLLELKLADIRRSVTYQDSAGRSVHDAQCDYIRFLVIIVECSTLRL